MAYSLSCRITIGDLILHSAHSVEIESGWKKISDRCTIELPNRGVIKKESGIKREVSLNNLFKTGQKVTVELGYNDNLNTEFIGYISEIQPGIKMTLICEDETYNLKRSAQINKSYKSVKLKALLTELVPDVKLAKLPDVDIENFRIERATKAYVLQELADKYGLAVYFKKGVLRVGLPYGEVINKGQIFRVFYNVIDEDLKYLKSEDVRLKVRAVSKLPNNKKIEVEVGDQDGEERTLQYYNIYSLQALKEIAEADMKRYKYEGYRGKITTFGIPLVEHGETIELSDPRFVERKGKYLIESIKTTFGTGGFRREIELAIKVG
jgi:hypothetical protein